MEQARKSLHCHKWNIKSDSDEGSEESKVRNLQRFYLSPCHQNAGRNMKSKGHSVEVSDRNRVLESRVEAILVIKWQKDLVSVPWNFMKYRMQLLLGTWFPLPRFQRLLQIAWVPRQSLARHHRVPTRAMPNEGCRDRATPKIPEL